MQLTMRLAGRKIANVQTNGNVVSLQLEDGSEVCLGWADDNGKLIKGRPVMVSSGARLKAYTLHDLIRLPQ